MARRHSVLPRRAARIALGSLLALGAPRWSLAAEPAPPVDANAPAPPAAPPAPVPPAEPAPPPAEAAEAPAPAPPPETPPPLTPSAEASGSVEAAAPGLFEESLAAPPAATGEPSGGRGYELGGYVRGDVFVGKVPGADRGKIQAAYGELALAVTTEKERYGDARAELRFRYGQQGETRDLFVDLREAYVNAYAGPVHVRLGHQIIVWGRADAFNPTNNLTPFDLRVRSPIEDDRRVGNVGARVFLNFAPVRVEGVWMPLYSAVEYPPIELPEFVTLTEPSFPEPELENGLGAARVHLELPAFELSASYLYGHAPLPGFALRDYTVGVTPTVIRVWRKAYDHHVAGFDFSTAFGEVLALRGEAAYRHPVDYEDRPHAPRPDLQYVLGLDRAFGSVNVIVQYVGRTVFDWERAEGPEDPIDPDALSGFMEPLPPFLRESIELSIEGQIAPRNQALFQQTERVQHLASARVEWLALHETLSLSALGLANFSTEEWLLYPKVLYRLSDATSASVGAEIYSGPDGTLLDLIEERLSAVYAELRSSF